MEQVFPGIYRLRMPLPFEGLDHINAYLVKGDKGCLLVDTGWDSPDAVAALNKQLDEINVPVSTISTIVITHIHPDHYGQAGKLKELSGAKIACHVLEKELIESRYVAMADLLKRTAAWLQSNGVPLSELPEMRDSSLPVVRFVAIGPTDISLQGGETVSAGSFSFRVIWTPGHSPGHVCLYEPAKKLLVTGDHLLPDITPNIGLHPQSSANPLGDFIKSLENLKKLDVDLVLPGHGSPFRGMAKRIDEILEHHQARLSQILESVKAQTRTGYQVASNLVWLADIGGMPWNKLAPLDRRLAVLETLAHLELLRAEGSVERYSRDGLLYYRPGKAKAS